MKYFKYIFLLLVFSLIFNCIIAQINQYEDVVYLKNGSIIHGMIIETIPNVTIKIQTADRNVFVFKMDEILKITKEIKQRKNKLTDTISKFYSKKKNQYYSLGFGYGYNYGGVMGIRFQQRFGKKTGYGYNFGIGIDEFQKQVFTISNIELTGGVKLYFFKGFYYNFQITTMNWVRESRIVSFSNTLGGDWFIGKHVGFNFDFGLKHYKRWTDYIVDVGIIYKFFK